jgi:phage repressor protein C with HTH and peptisase S24 domain
MFTHAEVWRGIDRLARKNGLSPSGLAKSAGLDATTFNPSKRVTKEKKARWPSTESIAKILDATNTALADFVVLMRDDSSPAGADAGRRLRRATLGGAPLADQFDQAGFAVGSAWQEAEFPAVDDPQAYAVEIAGDRFEPFLRDGDLLIVVPSASVRRRDRVLLMHRSGDLRVGQLVRRTGQQVEFRDYTAQAATGALPAADIVWMARIAWIGQ